MNKKKKPNKKLLKYIRTYLKKGHSIEKIEKHIIKEGIKPDAAKEAVRQSQKQLHLQKRIRVVTIFATILVLATFALSLLFLKMPPPQINEIMKQTCVLSEGIECEAFIEDETQKVKITNSLDYDITDVMLEFEELCEPFNTTINKGKTETYECIQSLQTQ